MSSEINSCLVEYGRQRGPLEDQTCGGLSVFLPSSLDKSYCGVSTHGDIRKPPGQGPGQPGLGGSARAGDGRGDLQGFLPASALR